MVARPHAQAEAQSKHPKRPTSHPLLSLPAGIPPEMSGVDLDVFGSGLILGQTAGTEYHM